MNGRPGKPDQRNERPDASKAPLPEPPVEEEEEDGDIATPKRDRDDEAAPE